MDKLECRKVKGFEATLQGVVNDNIELASSTMSGLNNVESAISGSKEA